MTDDIAVFRLFARILDYPQADLPDAVRDCRVLVAQSSPEAAAQLQQFHAFVVETAPARLEEIYTATFDLNAACPPYVGYHLFGDSYKRSVFMLELDARYQAQGFRTNGDLPDHLAVMLRFLAECHDPVLAHEIVLEALLPALGAMVGACQPAEDAHKGLDYAGRRPPQADTHPDVDRLGPYGWVLGALRLALTRRLPC